MLPLTTTTTPPPPLPLNPLSSSNNNNNNINNINNRNNSSIWPGLVSTILMEDDYARRQRNKQRLNNNNPSSPISSSSSYQYKNQQKSSKISKFLYWFVLSCLLLFYIVLFHTYYTRYHHQPLINDLKITKNVEKHEKLEKLEENQQKSHNDITSVQRVIDAMRHAYGGYEKYAFGHDEVRPMTNATNDSWGGMAITMIDSLDTLYMMGLEREFDRALTKHVSSQMKTLIENNDRSVSVFETTIRYLGGLLSAHDLLVSNRMEFGSKREEQYGRALLDRATELANRLLWSFIPNSASGSSTLSKLSLEQVKNMILSRSSIASSSSSSSLPYHEVNLKSGVARNAQWTGGSSSNTFILSEVASIQLEFQHLSERTGDVVYARAVNKAFDIVIDAHEQWLSSSPSNKQYIGLYPVFIQRHEKKEKKVTDNDDDDDNEEDGENDDDGNGDPYEYSWNSHITLGGLADSTYEYLLKQYLLSNRSEPKFLKLFLNSVVGIQKQLIVKWRKPTTMERNDDDNDDNDGVNKREQDNDNDADDDYLLFPVEIQNAQKIKKFEHLTCFVPGMLALGYQQLTQSEIDAQSKHLSIEDQSLVSRSQMLHLAKELMRSCVYLYESQPTGIGADTVSFDHDNEPLQLIDPKYLLRPETVESLYLLYVVTRDESYREVAWKMFLSIEKYCRTPTAYSGLSSVVTGEQNNSMQSFFLAETLKYLYLLFSCSDGNDGVIRGFGKETNRPFLLKEWVLTTEAHPFRVHSRK